MDSDIFNDKLKDLITSFISDFFAWKNEQDIAGVPFIKEITTAVAPQNILDDLIREAIPEYQDGTIQVILVWDQSLQEFHPDAWYEYKGEMIGAHFNELVGEDTDPPTILDILRECILQDTANAVISVW